MTRLTHEEKHLIKNNLYAFYLYFVASKFSHTVHAPHILKLSCYLTRIAYDPNTNNRLCVAMPPQHSKSSMTTVAYSVWLLLRNPRLKILIVNAEAGLSETFGIQIRQLLEETAPLFNLRLSQVKSSKTYMMLEDEDGRLLSGEIRLTGASGSITGHPADIIIIDDPYKGIDDITPTLLQKKIDWYRLIIEQRIRLNTKLILLHTRWANNDLQGYLWENDHDSYDWVMFQAIDKEGNILWPEYYTRGFYENKRRRQGEREFQALYQQKPLDETGNFFDVEKIRWENNPLGDRYYLTSCRSWDMAYTKVENNFDDSKDYTAGVPMFKVNENEYWIHDYRYGQFGDDNIREVKTTARADGVGMPILIEPGPKGGAAKEVFRMWQDQLIGYNVHQSEPIGTKADRAYPFKNAMLDGKIHVCILDDKKRQTFIEQLKSFPNGKHDDIVDACAYAYNYLKDKGDARGLYRTGNARY